MVLANALDGGPQSHSGLKSGQYPPPHTTWLAPASPDGNHMLQMVHLLQQRCAFCQSGTLRLQRKQTLIWRVSWLILEQRLELHPLRTEADILQRRQRAQRLQHQQRLHDVQCDLQYKHVLRHASAEARSARSHASWQSSGICGPCRVPFERQVAGSGAADYERDMAGPMI